MKGPGLYIHIPFCLSKCSYCDFFSLPCTKISEGYIERIIEEHNYRRKQVNGAWATVYVGGGTPSLLSHHAINTLFSSVRPCCIPDAEITFECNPGDVTEDLLTVLKTSGVTRISLGIQTFSDDKLQFCKRRSSSFLNHTALTLIQRAKFPHFSADLIAGLPPAGDDSHQLIEDIDQLMSYGVDHISLYSLSIEEGTPLFSQVQQDPSLIDESDTGELWICGRDYLEKKGFLQYEVSNFAKKGAQSIHNNIYWNMKDYAGLGSGATGTLFKGKTAERYTNSLLLDDYLSKDFSLQEDRLIIPERDCINEFLMMGFRKREGVSPDEFLERFGIPLKDIIEPFFSDWIGAGKAAVTSSGNYALTGEGLLFLNSFLLKILL